MTNTVQTAEILANRADLRAAIEQFGVSPAVMTADAALFAERLAASLPDIASDVVGRVLLHASDLYLLLATVNDTRPPSPHALIAVQILGEAGERLYAAEAAATPTDTHQEQP